MAEGGVATEPVLAVDGGLSCGGATVALAEIIERLGPFGSGNPEPRFALTGARVVNARIVGTNHISCVLTDTGGGRLKAIAFRAADSALGQTLMSPGGVPLSLAGRVKLDRWNGDLKVQFQIEDVGR